jgi:hypothetical protein
MPNAKDQRLYAKFTLDFPTHPKIAPLSDVAFRTWFEMILYSRQHLTDGFISRRLVGEAKGKQGALWLLDACFELLQNDDKNPSLLEVENGYLIHDFCEHQTTKAEIEALQETRKRAGQLGGIASGEARRKQTRSKRLKQKGSKTNPETSSYYVATTDAHAARANGAPRAPTPPETFEQALARAERESKGIF